MRDYANVFIFAKNIFYLKTSMYPCRMDEIKQLIYDGKTDDAIRLLDAYIKEHPQDDNAFYLRGKAYRKQGNTRQALNNYLSAMELNPDSPAHHAYQMEIEILDFYDKNLYNQ